jgi:hypothetical protein
MGIRSSDKRHGPFDKPALIDPLADITIKVATPVVCEALQAERLEHKIGRRLEQGRRLQGKRGTLGERACGAFVQHAWLQKAFKPRPVLVERAMRTAHLVQLCHHGLQAGGLA